MNDCCLSQMSNVSAISWRVQVTFWWNDDDDDDDCVRFVLTDWI
jgi:hypothetical protein